ncbi:hypothetical protein A2110_00135 [Candidatus Jorgensenbacteria bacterium GWA1_54_12]|uniref:Uncharacterized protein n=1 Tax=Candidatus Jorgensenbacteria bacterium GWA1_54_12 TaxID=1798468 RepID=A0A1F6BIJ9_9BACT|nr:MAG: hypothetical protein A2110_00135 [Candidatus Jorgensenbacteria bacterium GWA1_54_12]
MGTFLERYPRIRTELTASVTVRELYKFLVRIISAYDNIALVLPDTMGWKRIKPRHARECAKRAEEFAPFLGVGELEQAFFAVLFAAHDLGRMVQATIQGLAAGTVALSDSFKSSWDLVLNAERPAPYPDELHGLDSVRILRPIFGAFAETDVGRWALTAVECHSHKNNPTLDVVGGVREALELAKTLRDLDKVEGFRATAAYVGNPERKATERLQNWPDRLAGDPEWGTELRRIDPPAMLNLFEREEVIPRRECRSYETYMLQFLAWVFQITQPEMLDIALSERGPQQVVTYLLDQLCASQEQRDLLLAKLVMWHNGRLLE